MKHEFKPFDRVLVMDVSAGDGWRASFFSHCRHGHYVTINGWEFDRMIPYEGNEHLLGTTDEPEPKFKKGDIVLVWDEGDTGKRIRAYSHFDIDFCKHVALNVLHKDGSTEGQMWDHVERFVPASVET